MHFLLSYVATRKKINYICGLHCISIGQTRSLLSLQLSAVPVNLSTAGHGLLGKSTLGGLFCVLYNSFFVVEVQFIYNIVLVSDVQKSDSEVYIYPFPILFHYCLLQNIDYGSLCYTAASSCLSVLYTVVCICQSQTPNLSFCPTFLLR